MNVLWAVDGSRCLRWAVELLRRDPVPPDLSLLLVHVVNPAAWRVSRDQRLATRETIRRGLAFAEQAAQRVRKQGSDSTALVADVPVGYRIVRAATTMRADLVVLGSRRLPGTVPYLLGSVSDSVVTYALCAVLVYRR